MKTLIAPRVNLNGTSQAALVRDLCTAATALATAISALAETAPHGRDYQSCDPAEPYRFKQAQLQHAQRVTRLTDVQAELCALAEAIDERRDSAEIE